MKLLVTIWDVQHGSACYIKTPADQHLVIDLGVGDITSSDAVFSPLRHLRSQGVQRLDEVIITHPHRDHLDDVDNFDSMNPRVLRRPKHLSEAGVRQGNRPGDSKILDKYFEISNRYNQPVAQAANPEMVGNNGGAEFACFLATQCPVENLNNHSLVTFIRYASTTICIPGDNESPSWNELLKKPAFQTWLRRTGIFVAAHHGREAGYCPDVFEYCQPYLVIVSDGPESDTSAIDKYRAAAKGWRVRSRSTGKSDDRRVVTTRCDGTVQVETYTGDDGTNYLGVSIE